MAATSCSLSNNFLTLMRLIPLYLNYQTPRDLSSPLYLRNGSEYDFIIVGGGTAGSVLASKLSEKKNWTVLLLEAGGEPSEVGEVPAYQPYTMQTRLTWHYAVEPDSHFCGGQPCSIATGKGLGGGGLHFGMVYNRGNKINFDSWNNSGNPGWSFDELLPIFKRCENNLDPDIASDREYHGVGGKLSVGRFPYKDRLVEPFLRAFEGEGYLRTDINGRNQTGCMDVEMFRNKDGSRVTTYRSYVASNRYKRRNLEIHTNVRVTKVIIDPETKVAQGVEYAWENDRNRTGKVFARKEVIVSAGAIASPQLLLLSGIGPAETLRPLGIPVIQNLQVGENFHTHQRIGLDLIVDSEHDMLPDNKQVLSDLWQYRMRSSGPLSAEGTLQTCGYINSDLADPSLDFPDIQYVFFTRTVCNGSSMSTPSSYYNRVRVAPLAVQTKNRGRVTINSTDPFSLPVLYASTNNDTTDFKVLKYALHFVNEKFVQSRHLRNLGITLDTTPVEKCRQFAFGSSEYFECYTENYTEMSTHVVGSCKMGPATDVSAVVDSELRVHNITHLRVVDGSIMPVVVNGNTYATIVVIAEKASDYIKKTWTS